MGDYPVVLRLEGRPCLVVGGGRLARAKAEGLLAAGSAVHVVAPEVDPELAGLAGVTVERRPFRDGDCAGYWFVVAATGDPAANRVVHDDAERAGVWVNAADDPDNCTVTLPAVARRGPIAVAVSTGGVSPALATWLRRTIEEQLGSEHEVLAELLAEHRQALRSAGVPTEGLPWQAVLDGGVLDLIRAGEVEAARERIRAVALERSAWQ